MGCDIHLYFEQKNKEGKWQKIEIDERLLPDDRNYLLFAFLANVRNYGNSLIKPQFEDRRVPEDSSVDQHFYDCSDHSITHAYLNEILAAPWELVGLDKCYFKIFCEEIIPRLCSWCGSLSKEDERNIRVIIGFDN
jgi:hypothetical protein